MNKYEYHDDDDQSDVDWLRITRRLAMFSMRLISRRGLQNEIDPEDLINSAIEKFLAGERHYDEDKGNFYSFLCGVIRSEISNLARKKSLSVVDIDSDYVESSSDNSPSPEKRYLYNEEKRFLYNYIEEKDPTLLELAKLMLDYELAGSIDLANTMKISTEEVNNAKKRLRRLVQKIK